jgi:IclR family pca regulon transcriptional regulator
VRADGFCTLISELADGFAGISVPLHDQTGKTVAGLGLSMVLGSRDQAYLEKHYLPPLRRTAAQIESILKAR